MKVSSLNFVRYKCTGFSVTIKLFYMLLNVQCMQCDTVKVAMETWHFGSVNGVSDRKTFALHCITVRLLSTPTPQLLCFSVGR